MGYPEKCRRPNRHPEDELCFCPANRETVATSVRARFINGWVHSDWYREAARLPSDASVADCEALLFKIEYDANLCYGLWRQSQ